MLHTVIRLHHTREEVEIRTLSRRDVGDMWQCVGVPGMYSLNSDDVASRVVTWDHCRWRLTTTSRYVTCTTSNCFQYKLIWHCPHGMHSRVYETVQCLSVCLSQHGPTAANPLQQVCFCGSCGQQTSIDYCSSSVRRTNAGSATLSAYIRSWTQTCLLARFYWVVEQTVSEHWRKYTALTPTSGLAKLFI